MDQREKFNADWDEEFKKFWLPLLTTKDRTGKPHYDKQKIKNQLQDLVFCLQQTSKVYSEITEGMLSKQNYYADVIISKYQEQLIIEYDRGYREGMAEALQDQFCSPGNQRYTDITMCNGSTTITSTVPDCKHELSMFGFEKYFFGLLKRTVFICLDCGVRYRGKRADDIILKLQLERNGKL
jgi:hypothetical protein